MKTAKDLIDMLAKRVSHLDDSGRRVNGILEEIWSNGFSTRVTVYYGEDPARRRDGEVYRRNFNFEPAQDWRLYEYGFEKVGA